MIICVVRMLIMRSDPSSPFHVKDICLIKLTKLSVMKISGRIYSIALAGVWQRCVEIRAQDLCSPSSLNGKGADHVQVIQNLSSIPLRSLIKIEEESLLTPMSSRNRDH